MPIYQANYKSLDRGPSDFDRRNVFTASYVWTLPRLSNGNLLLRAAVNGWQTMGIFQVQSGPPLTVTAGKDASLTGLQQDRAVFSGSAAYGSGACSATAAHCVNYLNPAAFTLPATGSFDGNVVKGSFPRTGILRLGREPAGRSFPLKGEAGMEFRAEYFNLLNRTNLLAPVTAKSAGGFGSITSANDPEDRGSYR